jgi:iron complex transport system permease protein
VIKLVLFLAILAALSLLIGPSGLGMPDPVIFWQLRVPRTGLAILVGGGLGLSGAVLQGALRNPLADPGLLGIGGCAALGAVCVFYWGVSTIFPPALAFGGLFGAAFGCLALLVMSARAASGPGLILAGVALSALASAFLAMALIAAPNPFALYEITFWLMGGLEDRTLTHLALCAVPTLAGCIVLLRLGPGLDAISLGESTASSLGVPLGATLRTTAAGVALATGAGAAVAGGIGFVGLVVPHLLRPLYGERPASLLAPSMVLGAALLLVADIFARLAVKVLPLAQEPRLGVLTALIGAPFLIAIARRASA